MSHACCIEADVNVDFALSDLVDVDICACCQQEHLSFYKTDNTVEEKATHFVLGAKFYLVAAAISAK